MRKSAYIAVKPYKTKDGSTIRELMHPGTHENLLGVKNQSLAEATIEPGESTQAHYHKTSEELYFIQKGEGRMTLGDSVFTVSPGDTVCITPGTTHWIENVGDCDLVILCSCAPAYDHDDTILA